MNKPPNPAKVRNNIGAQFAGFRAKGLELLIFLG